MINFREIFNLNYSLVGIIIIIIMIGLILLINQDIKYSLKQIGKSIFIAGIITIIISFISKQLIVILIPNKYQVIINIITKNLIKNMNIYSLISILIGLILIIISSIKKEIVKHQ